MKKIVCINCNKIIVLDKNPKIRMLIKDYCDECVDIFERQIKRKFSNVDNNEKEK